LFTLKGKDGQGIPVGCGDYLYETIIVLWLRAWVDYVEGMFLEPSAVSSSFTGGRTTFSVPDPHSAESPQPRGIFSFYAHMDILLPICLKSIVLRYSVEVVPRYPPCTRALVDENHMLVLEPFIEMLARGLVGQSLAGIGSAESRDKALVRALSSSDVVLEFIVGLVGILHASHIHTLLKKFFKTLRDSETEHLDDSFSEVSFEWSEESLHRVRCSRHLRVRTIETLSVLPSFLALNYPSKYSGNVSTPKVHKANWLNQYIEIPEERVSSGDTRHGGVSPPSGWLAELVISEGLSVCAMSCEAVVAEAMAHIEVTQEKSPYHASTPSLKKRPGAALKRGDLLMFQSLGIHAITAVYELILRRHSMDRRFQSDSCRERIAGLFAIPILEKSIESVRWMARLEATHKVRSVWLLCFVYVLQEAPDCMIRDYVRSLCNPKVS
jgi:hypothetical protein